MILNNKNAKKLKMNQTIDLKYINAKEYCKKVEKNRLKEKIFDNLPRNLFYIWAISTLFFFLLVLIPQNTFGSLEEQQMSIRDKIRLERLEICQKAYKEAGIEQKFLYEQLPVVRCATYMWLVYAFESNFWKSRLCVEDKNCHWMRWNWIDHPKGFIKFNSYTEWREWFANRYFKFHYKKKINEFVNSWSMTDREAYKNFMWKRYSQMYWELEYFYLTWRNK